MLGKPISLFAHVSIVIVLCAQSLSAQSTEKPAAPTARSCHELLRASLVDFYLPHCVDQTNGGYHETLGPDGKFQPTEKFLTLQARHLWFFSRLARADIRRAESLEAAESGYRFLIEHFLDAQHGGYFTKTSREGVPTDRRKHVYPMSFVIYGLVEYANASGTVEPLDQAMELFADLEVHCYDQQHGGYREFFYDDWREITDPNENGYIGAIGTKTYNSHLHLMEALTALLRARPDAAVKQRLAELLQINTVTVKHPDYPCNIDGWNRDWTMIDTPRNLRASYGHDVECVWLALDAAEALGRPVDILRGWATALCGNSIQHGYDSQLGGFFYTGPLDGPSDDRKKEWWTQSEAMVAMLVMEKYFGGSERPSYREIFEHTYDFVAAHHVVRTETDPPGGWWATVKTDGAPMDFPSRTSMWQGAYHNGRALLNCAELLSE